MSQQNCALPVITKNYTYEESYIGGKGTDGLRRGPGIYHWIGPKSIECYEGNFFNNTLNGYGEYRCRYCEDKATSTTYEGNLYANDMHGYGTMSYSDGRTFTGLFRNNVRYGPGIQKYVTTEADVGIWCRNQLIRLSWQPIAPYSLVPDFTALPHGKVYVDMFRKIVAETYHHIDLQRLNAIETLKEAGADPVFAANNWKKLFSKHMSDTQSPACYVDALEYNCYKGEFKILEEVESPEFGNSSETTLDDTKTKLYYPWNDTQVMIDMMKHIYAHDRMRNARSINLEGILNGPRPMFNEAGLHEKHCRMLLMASFVGIVDSVVRMVNTYQVHPDVSDMKGNSALMYATCGDHQDIIHFLVEAGANVNSYNDSCCTPLCVALMRSACASRGIEMKGLFHSVIPPGSDDIDDSGGRITDWQIDRHLHKVFFDLHNVREIVKPVESKVIKSVQATKPRSILLKKTQFIFDQTSKIGKISVEKRLDDTIKEKESDLVMDDVFCSYNSLKTDYLLEVIGIYTKNTEARYLFDVDNMYVEALAVVNICNTPATPEKPLKRKSKAENEDSSNNISYYWQHHTYKIESDKVSNTTATVAQLLNDGADPQLVRCPHPALNIALASGSTAVLRLLLDHGATVDQILYEPYKYTALDIVVSRPFNVENRDLIQVLLEHGSDVSHRIFALNEPGPTLMHIIVMRAAINFQEIEIRDSILLLFAKHSCDPLIQYRGKSIIDIMLNKNVILFKNFNANAKFDRNAPINDFHQNILVKMFSKDYFLNFRTLALKNNEDLLQIIYHTIKSGADPLLPCQDDEKTYSNFFQFANKQISEFPSSNKKKHGSISSKSISSKLSSSSKRSGLLDSESKDLHRYHKALNVVIESTRENYIIWIRAKLVKNLVRIIHKFKYRSWHMIMKEHDEHKAVGFWLTQSLCLDIWNVLKSTNKKVFKDNNILKYLLFIVMFYNMKRGVIVILDDRVKGMITSAEKRTIEIDTLKCLKEQRKASPIEITLLPVFTSKMTKKFNVCFECFSTVDDSKILCSVCEIVSFCGDQCFLMHMTQGTMHPCRSYLRDKENINYLPPASIMPSLID